MLPVYCKINIRDDFKNVKYSDFKKIFSFQKSVLPETITDQIRLWEMERDRFKFSDGVLYSQFLSQHDFELLRDYAKVGYLGSYITKVYLSLI